MKRGKGSILIVEDDANEQLLMKNAFEQLNIIDHIHTTNGEQAIAYLKGDEPYADRKQYPFPTFLLTDLRMPKVNGFELLLFIKRTRLIIIPTVVLSVSAERNDIQSAYMLGANAYHVKPNKIEDLRDVLKNIYDYWSSVELPNADEARDFNRTEHTGSGFGDNIRPLIGR